MHKLVLILVLFIYMSANNIENNEDIYHLNCSMDCFKKDNNKTEAKVHKICEIDPITLKPIDETCVVDTTIPIKKSVTSDNKIQIQIQKNKIIQKSKIKNQKKEHKECKVDPITLKPIDDECVVDFLSPVVEAPYPKKQKQTSTQANKQTHTQVKQASTKKTKQDAQKSGYFIQAGVLFNKPTASKKFKAKVAKLGYKLYQINKTNKDTKQVYTILLIGDFKGYSFAKKALEDIHKNLKKDAYIIHLNLDTSATHKQQDIKRKRTKEKEQKKKNSSVSVKSNYFIQIGVLFTKPKVNKKYEISINRLGYKLYQIKKIKKNSQKTYTVLVLGDFISYNDVQQALPIIQSKVEKNAFILSSKVVKWLFRGEKI